MPRLLCFAVYIKRFCVQSFSLEVFLFPSILSLYVFLRRLAQKYKRDRPTKHFLSPYQPHILDSNGVWYSPFWLEGPKNHPNLKILVSKFVPWDLKGHRTSDLEGQRHGTSRGSTFRTSRGGAMGPQSPRCAVPWGPMGPPLEVWSAAPL